MTASASEYVEAFTLGNAAILSNVCLLPLYPGMLVMLANRRGDATPRTASAWMGVSVLAGVVSSMVAIGFVMHQLGRAVADILDWLLPVMYTLVGVLGGALIVGVNPFARLATTEAPVVRSATASAYLYGMLLAPMTLPCTGPLIISAFVIGGVSGSGALADSLTYFVAFALGFGWPLVALPLLAAPAQRTITRWLARHHRVVEMCSGVLLIVVAVIGWRTDVLPNR